MNPVDDQIAAYRERLRAEADLAERDLNELEDHLRELTEELRTTGMSAVQAVTEAAQRLGDPRQLAREHTRVRPRLGMPLSTGRALSAAVLFIAPLLVWAFSQGLSGLSVRFWLETGAFVAVAVALAARQPWARAAVLGLTAHGLISALWLPVEPLFWVRELGLLAFVMPWRRIETSRAALSIGLLAWAYEAASSIPTLQLIAGHSQTIASVCGSVAFAFAAAGCIGIVQRARWSAIAASVTAIALLTALGDLMARGAAYDGALGWSLYVAGVGSGAVAATVSAVLCWRAVLSMLGSRHRAA